MADRTDIGARIGLEGAKSFSNDTKLAAGEVKTLNAALRELETRLDDETKQKEKDAEKTKLLADKVKAHANMVALLSDELKQQTDNQKKLKEELDAARASHEENSKEVNAAEQAYVNQSAKVDNLAAKLNNAQTALNKATAEMKAHGNELQQMGRRWQESGDKITSAGQKITSAGKGLSVLSGAAIAAGVASGKAAIDFESDFTGVVKVVDATAQELEGLKQGVIDMSREMPSTTSEINEVAAAAGQLGIEVPNILSFSRAMLDLGNATDINAGDAAMQLAQLANITKMSQGDFDRLGSSIVHVGNNVSTTESKIVDMAQRIAAAGSAAGLSEADIIGLAGGFASLGLEAEGGGSAVSKVITDIHKAIETGSDSMEDYATVAGMSAAEFSKAWGKDAAGALAAFISGLGDVERNGESAIVIMDKMDITERRMTDALMRAAGSEDVLSNALQLSNDAWTENNALTQEANLRYSTTASKLQIAKNEFTEAARSLGEEMLPTITEFIGAGTKLLQNFNKLDKGTKKNIVTIGAWIAILGPATVGVGKFTEGIGKTTTSIGKLIEKAGKLTTSTTGLSGALGKAVTGISGMAGPLAIAGVGVASLGTSIAIANGYIEKQYAAARELYPALEDSAKAYERYNEVLVANNQSAAESESAMLSQFGTAEILVNKIRELEASENDDAVTKYRIKTAVEQLNEVMPQLNVYYDEQTNSVEGLTSATDDYLSSLKEEAILQLKRDKLTALIQQQAEAEIELTKAEAARQEIIEAGGHVTEKYSARTKKYYNQYSAAYVEASDNVRHWQNAHKEATEAVDELDQLFTDTFVDNAQQRSNATMEQGRQYGLNGATMRQEMADTTNAVVDGYGQQGEAARLLSEEEQQILDDRVKRLDSYTEAATNMFDKIKTSSDISVSQMTENLNHNAKAVEDWASNLVALGERTVEGNRIVNEGLLQMLKEAGPEQTAGTIAALVNASDEQLVALSEAYANGGQAAVEALKAELGISDVAQAGSDMVDDISGAVEDNSSLTEATTKMIIEAKDAADSQVAASDFGSVGTDMTSGIANGVRSGKSEVVEAMREAVREGVLAAQAEAEINSPSKLTEKKLGDPMMDGWVVSIYKNIVKIKRAMGEAVEESVPERSATGNAIAYALSGSSREIAAAFASLPQPRRSTESVIEEAGQKIERSRAEIVRLQDRIAITVPVQVNGQTILAKTEEAEVSRGVHIGGAFENAR